MPDDNILKTERESTDTKARVFNVDPKGQPTTMLVLAEHTGFPVVLQLPLGNGIPDWSANEIRTILCALCQEIAHVRNGGTLGTSDTLDIF